MQFNPRLFTLLSVALFVLKILLVVQILPEGVPKQDSNISGVTLYRSTDFDVHRHWKAITRNLPLNEWYKETGHSIWTLDYPPFFAYFESLLSNVIHPLLQPTNAEKISNKNTNNQDASNILFNVKLGRRHLFSVKNPISSGRKLLSDLFYDENLTKLGSSRGEVTAAMVRFMRASVIVFGDLPLYVLLFTFLGNYAIESAWFTLLLCAHPALLLVDNIHFQYNSLVFSVFVASIFAADQKSPFIAAAFYFALLLLKHLFLCYAPAFGIWGLCVIVTNGRKEGWIRGGVATAIRFTMVLVLVVSLALAPLVLKEYEVLAKQHSTAKLFMSRSLNDAFASIPANVIASFKFNTPAARAVESLKRAVTPMLERMFPFGRGLCHAYWAPNAFPLYNVADRYLCKHVIRSRGSFASLARASVQLLRSIVGQPELVLLASKDFCDNVSVNTKGLVHLSAAANTSSAASVEAAAKLAQAPSHAVLPSITPTTCIHLVLVGFFILAYSFFPPIVFVLRLTPEQQQKVYDKRPRKMMRKFLAFAEHVAEDGAEGLLKMCVASSLSFFLFGWHVHEKAILNVLFPVVLFVALQMRAVGSRLSSFKISFQHATHLDFLNVNLMASLVVLPLLFTVRENVFKYLLLFAHQACAKAIVAAYVIPPRDSVTNVMKRSTLAARFTSLLLHSMVLISFWVDLKNGETFLPLMIYSCVGSIALFGVIGSIRRILYQQI